MLIYWRVIEKWSGWWFGTCFIFPFSWESSSQLTNSIIFQRARYTTNQNIINHLMHDTFDQRCCCFFLGVITKKSILYVYGREYKYTWTFLRSIIFGSFGVWPKMTQFSESRLILLVCLVLLPSGHTITTSDILNMTDWTWLASWLRPRDIPGHSHIPSTNAYKCT